MTSTKPISGTMTRRGLLRALAVGGIGLGAIGAGAAVSLGLRPVSGEAEPLTAFNPRQETLTLDEIEAEVEATYRMAQITPEALAARIGREPIALFDIRTFEEYASGHIAGAIHVDPAITPAAFLRAHGARTSGAQVVFYCSIGVRSSRLMRQIGESLAPFHPIGVSNLRGGLFRWHAQTRPVVAGGLPAGSIHPFDPDWNVVLDRTLRGS